MNDSPRPSLSSFAVGVDLGGHGLKGLLLDSSGQRLAEDRLHLKEDERGVTKVEERFTEQVTRLLEQSPDPGSTSVGIGVPGFIEGEECVLRASPNFPEWVDVPLRQRLEGLVGRSVAIENDANCALLGERWLGAGEEKDNLLLVSLGTGVGTAAMIGGRLLKGSRGLGAEGGHVPLYPGGRKCGCGQRGCLETYASGPGLALTAKEAWYEQGLSGLPPEGSALDVFRAETEAGGPSPEHWASRGIERYCLDLAQGLAGLVHLLAPSRIVISGGVSGAWARIGPPITEALEKRCIPAFLSGGLDLRPALLGDYAGAAGAALVAFQAEV